MSKIINIVDLGSNKIAAIQARINKNGTFHILEAVNTDSQGIAGGDVTDINKAAQGITATVNKLKPVKPKSVFAITKGSDVKMDISRGMIPLSKIPREIGKKDIDRSLEVASMIKIPLGRGVVEKIVRGFYIDGTPSRVVDPFGLYGIKLEAEIFITTVNQSKIQNITKCIDHAGLMLDGLYFSGMASSYSVLEDEDKKRGVLLLDIGESLTEGLFFKDGTLQDFYIIEMGVNSILAEDSTVDKEKLSSFFNKVSKASKKDKENLASLVLTGGGALLEGVIEEAEKDFNVPARIGTAYSSDYELNTQDSIIHTSTIGLIKRIAEEYRVSNAYGGPVQRIFHKLRYVYESYF